MGIHYFQLKYFVGAFEEGEGLGKEEKGLATPLLDGKRGR